MNDIEFAHRLSTPIGQLYEEAKRSQRHFPRNTLISLRSLASMCCDMLQSGDASDWPGGLDEKIRLLSREKCINHVTRESLNQLRCWGNTGAHPEQRLVSEEQQFELAAKAISTARSLLETVYQHHFQGANVPLYEVVETISDELKETCFKALVENSSSDQYRIALLIRSKIDERRAQASAAADPELQFYTMMFEIQAEENRALDLLRYASDAGYPPARYSYGLALTEGECGEEKVMYGVNLIYMACNDGDINALAWCGRSAMQGRFDEPVDYAQARDYLEKAAAEDHPMALSLLSEMYREGLGVARNVEKAFSLILRAANAGYALAQHNAAVSYVEGIGVEVDIQKGFDWFRRASDAGYASSKFSLAKGMLNRQISGESDEIEALLSDAAEHENEAHLLLAEIHSRKEDHVKWLEAANRIQLAYEKALAVENKPVIKQCSEMSPKIISKLEAAIPTMSESVFRDFMTTRFILTRSNSPIQIEKNA